MSNKLKLKKVGLLPQPKTQNVIQDCHSLNSVFYKENQRKKKKKKHLKNKNQSFFTFLVKVDAFIGDTYLKSHYTHNSHVYAFRNNHVVYDAPSSYLGLKYALQFLNKQKLENLIFVGSPTNTASKCKEIFASYKVRFFPSQLWIPGYISKDVKAMQNVLIIYDIFLNGRAKSEGFNCNLPIIGFVSKYGNNDGLDYSICLNFDNCGLFYIGLWKSFFFSKIKKIN